MREEEDGEKKEEEEGRGGAWHQGAKAGLWEPSRESGQLQSSLTHTAESREVIPAPRGCTGPGQPKSLTRSTNHRQKLPEFPQWPSEAGVRCPQR